MTQRSAQPLEGRYSPYPLEWVPHRIDEHLDVLDRTGEVLLNGDSKESSPPGSIKPVPGTSGEGAFHEVLSRREVSPG